MCFKIKESCLEEGNLSLYQDSSSAKRKRCICIITIWLGVSQFSDTFILLPWDMNKTNLAAWRKSRMSKVSEREVGQKKDRGVIEPTFTSTAPQPGQSVFDQHNTSSFYIQHCTEGCHLKICLPTFYSDDRMHSRLGFDIQWKLRLNESHIYQKFLKTSAWEDKTLHHCKNCGSCVQCIEIYICSVDRCIVNKTACSPLGLQ